MKPVIIDESLCIGCGKCVKDCVGEKLGLVGGKAQFLYQRCIECGHCYAICPVGAIKMRAMPNMKEEKPFDISHFDSDDFLKALQSRRSIRFFGGEAVTDEHIDKLILAGSYCPTATNAQDISYIVLRGNAINKAEARAVELFRKAQKFASPFTDYIKNMTIDNSFFFKGASAVILVQSGSKTNGLLASSYIELMANNLGLGVLYSGFFVAATKFDKKLSAMLGLEKGKSLVSCLVIGNHDISYERIPPRKSPDVKVIADLF